MTTATLPTVRQARPADVVALQYANRYRMLAVPLLILGVVIVVSVVIGIAVLRVSVSATDSFARGFNIGALWALAGFHVALGVQSVSSSFPYALALGSTRRTFAIGTLLTWMLQSAYVAVVCVVLLGVEMLTGGWFIDVPVLQVPALGNGDALVLFGVVFLTLLTASAVGALFGSAWTRFGPRGPLVLSLALTAAVALLLVLLLPALIAAAAGFEPWWLILVALGTIAASTAGGYLFLRGASVR